MPCRRSLPRTYAGGNTTVLSVWTYALESGLHEMLLQSEHRTLDPEVRRAGGKWGNYALSIVLPLALVRLMGMLTCTPKHHALALQEADYFYVPIYTSCFIHPIRDFVDHPWFTSIHHNRQVSAICVYLCVDTVWAQCGHAHMGPPDGRESELAALWGESVWSVGSSRLGQ